MKRKKNKIYIIIGIFVLLMLAGLIYFSVQQSIFTIPHLKVQKEEFIFDGISGIAESPYFGTISNNDKKLWNLQGGGYGFCGSNDGDVIVSNSLQGGDELILTSSISDNRRRCLNNGIEINDLQIPEGNLSGICILKLGSPGIGINSAGCKVNGVNYGISFDENCAKYGGDKYRKCINTLRKTFNIQIKDPKKIRISIKTSVDNGGYGGGNAYAKLILNFVKKNISENGTYSDSINNTGHTNIIPVIEENNNYLLYSGVILLLMFMGVIIYVKKKRGR